MKWQKELELAKTVAKRAGSLLRELQSKPAHVLNADGRDLKLHADREAEKIIIKALKASSSYMILAEESGEHGHLDSGAAMWIVDPLDGTINFSRDMSLSCVSIALWQEHKPVLGVVYDFNYKELFSGVVGEGAWCNNEKVAVSNVTDTNKAILATGFPVNRNFESASLQNFLNSIQEFKKIRLLGSAALSLAYVACGRVDAYTEEDIMLWDVAAGVALVRAAGGWSRINNSSRNKWARYVKCAANVEIFHCYKNMHSL
jgi:myo-inositol-1(or 4)-monophosphatase